MILLTCDQELTKSQFSPTHASTKRTEELKQNAESYGVRDGSQVEKGVYYTAVLRRAIT